MYKAKKTRHNPFDRAELKQLTKGMLNVLKSIYTLGIVLPAMTASTNSFRIKKYGVDLATITDDEEILQNISINILKPHRRGILVATSKSLAHFCDLAEEFYRINPFTLYCAVSLAGIESLEEMLDNFNCRTNPKLK